MNDLSTSAALGDIVAYEDQANPRRLFRVDATPSAETYNQFKVTPVEPLIVRNDDDAPVLTEGARWTDLRQIGWTMVESTAARRAAATRATMIRFAKTTLEVSKDPERRAHAAAFLAEIGAAS